MSKLNIMVTGATGQQGGQVARRLLEKGHTVHAFTRKSSSPAAQSLQHLGARLVEGNFEDRTSLEKAMRGVEAVFAMSTPYEAGVETETREGIALVEAAKAVNLKHLVYTSVGSADQKTGIPHFESKFKVEQHIQKLGVPHTIIGPVFFMENLLSPWMLPQLKEGNLALAVPAARQLQTIALPDIANMAVLILENRDRFLGKRFDIASDERTGLEAAEILSRVSGRKIGYYAVPLELVRPTNEDFALMFEWFDRVGYNTDLAALRRDYPEVGWHTFEQWSRKQDWSVLQPQTESALA